MFHNKSIKDWECKNTNFLAVTNTKDRPYTVQRAYLDYEE